MVLKKKHLPNQMKLKTWKNNERIGVMRNIWTIARREYKLYFNGPIAYAVAFLFFLVMGVFIYNQLSSALESAMYQPFTPTAQMITGAIMVYLLIFTMPAITMRLLSEEQRTGTLELLLTAPIRDWELILGKWLGSFLFMSTLLAVTWIYPIILNLLTQPGIDQGPLLSGYLGLLLMAAALLAVGVAISALFSNQIVAFFISLAVVLFFFFGQPAAGDTSIPANVLNYLNLIMHYVPFYQGTIDIKDIMYYLSATALGLFVGTAAIEIRRWR
jgi:ABC-2 type transport system permease protein